MSCYLGTSGGGLIPPLSTTGTCTIAIVIVSDFPDPSALPGGFRTGPPTDTATYLGVNKIVENVVDRCVVSKGQAGWQPTGQYDGIGVFVWSTNSEQDKEIEDDRAGGVVPGGLEREGVGNGSVATT